MGENTKIEWAHHTFNPWWGCTRVSPGCTNCYANSMARRTGHDVWGDDKPRRMLSEKNWAKPMRWNALAVEAGERHRVFAGSMCDVFEFRPELEAPRRRFFGLMEATPQLDWMLLTKRPANLVGMTEHRELQMPWNAWAYTSCENQEQFDERIGDISDVRARVIGLSLEPLLGKIDISEWADAGCIDHVIVGAESGAGARPMALAWVRHIRDQCIHFHVPFFLKQRFDEGRKISMPELDSVVWDQMPREYAAMREGRMI